MLTARASAPLELALQRGDSYVPGSCSDGRKLGLAIGSGGGAGPVSLGELMSLDERGATRPVDAIYAVSIGGINAAAYAAGQIDVALNGYKIMTEKGFINRKRLYRIMDLRILERLLESDAHGLDTEAVANYPVPINVGVSRVSGELAPARFDLTQQDPDDVVDILLWGAGIIGLSGLARRDKKGIGGRKNIAYADGGFSQLSAVDMAFKDGCTDVIYLSNQPYAPDKYNLGQVLVFGAMMTPYDKRAIPHFDSIMKEQIRSRQVFRDGTFDYNGTRVTALYPPQSQEARADLPGLLNMDPRKITAGFEIAKNHILSRLPELAPARVVAATA